MAHLDRWGTTISAKRDAITIFAEGDANKIFANGDANKIFAILGVLFGCLCAIAAWLALFSPNMLFGPRERTARGTEPNRADRSWDHRSRR